MHQTDEALALAVQDGGKEAFGGIMERYEAKISRYGRKFLSNQDDIADLVQGIFIKAYINIKSFNASRRFSPWLYRIAHNEFVNALKKKHREPFFIFETDILFPHLMSRERSDRQVLDTDLKESLQQCLDKLSNKYCEVIILYFLEELSYKDIAEVLHIPISTVGIRIKRGKSELQKLYSELESTI